MNKENIKMLYDNHIDYYQITIDGDKETHDRTKKQDNEETSFGTILGNIVNLLNYNDRTNLTLRFNYTSKSLKSEHLINDVNSIIPPSLRHRISLDFHKIWQIDECSISIKDLGDMLMKFHKSGYRICSDHVFSICYVDKTHHNTIFYNGGVDKCDNFDIDKLRGHIDTTGHIIWKEKPLIGALNPLEKGNCCYSCKYYPLCYGCCPVRREEKIKEKGKMTCMYEGHYEVFQHRILDFCIRQLISKNLPL